MLGQLGARDHFALMMHQVGQHLELVGSELDRVAIDRGSARTCVDPQRPADQLRRGLPGGAADQRPQARDHLLHMERLGDVIIGPGIEAGDLLVPLVAGGENENGRIAPVIAPAAQHGDAVDLRQAEIEDDGIVRLGVAEMVRFLAVGGVIDGIAGIGQRLCQLPCQIGIVLGNQ